MYIVRRKEGEWVEVTSRSGDVLRIAIGRPTRGERGRVGSAELVFDDPERRFEIRRAEAESPWVEPRPSQIPIIVDPTCKPGDVHLVHSRTAPAREPTPEPKALDPSCYCRSCQRARGPVAASPAGT